MWNRMLTAIGYVKAPKATFVLRHPVKGTAALLAAKTTSRNTKMGLGAAALALPVGVWYLIRR
jgi:hypothetical protein